MQSKKWLPFGGVAFSHGLQDTVSQRSSLVSPWAPCFDLRRRMLVPTRWAGGGWRCGDMGEKTLKFYPSFLAFWTDESGWGDFARGLEGE